MVKRTSGFSNWRLARSGNLTNHPEWRLPSVLVAGGQWIAFSSDRDSKKLKFLSLPCKQPTFTLFGRMALDSDESRARDALAGGPAWPPDGKRVLYHETEISSLGPERGPSEIVSIDLATNERQVRRRAAARMAAAVDRR